MINKTTDEAINIFMHNLTENVHVSEDSGKETAIKALIYTLKGVNAGYKIQCYMKCLSILDKY